MLHFCRRLVPVVLLTASTGLGCQSTALRLSDYSAAPKCGTQTCDKGCPTDGCKATCGKPGCRTKGCRGCEADCDWWSRCCKLCNGCKIGGDGCKSGDDGWSFGDGSRRWTDDWYEDRACSPVGARQKCCHGKLWPPYPRPTGEKQEYWHRFHTAHYWPWPYVCYDRAYVNAVTDMQTANGWAAQCTLYGYHFDVDTHELTHAGELQLRWILENAPQSHRVAWVQTGHDKNVTQARLASVRDSASAMVGEQNVPPIMARVSPNYGRPALEVNSIRQNEISSMPQPRIEYTALPTGTE